MSPVATEAATITVNTSAIVAIVFGESDAERYAAALSQHAGACQISAPSLVEVPIVTAARLGSAGTQLLGTVLERTAMDVVAFDRDIADTASAAWRRFGKGRHPAALSIGDCFSYALAKYTGSRLLFKSDDFSQTDISSVL